MDASYRLRNDAAQARLATLVARLDDRDLDRPLGGGWTVKAALAHLAFWDRFAAALADGPLLEAIAAAGETWAVERGAHRAEHMDQIEQALTAAGPHP